MAFFRLVLFASKLNKVAKKLKAEKEAAVSISKKEKPKYGWRLILGHVWINCKRRIRNFFINLYFLKNTAFDRFLYRLRKYGSFENFILKSILGFFGGYLLTYLLFLFLTVQLNVRLTVATIICCILGCILTIGLAFSQKIRCIVFLTLPQLFSKRGRQALIAYAFILTMTGPAKNTLNNMGIMSESLACGQEQLKSAVRQILDVIKKPFVAIKDAIKAVVKAVKEVVKKIKEILIKIKRVVMSILGVIKSAFQFLGKILNICNKELGTPYQRCSRVFESAVVDCQASLGPFFSWACSIGHLLSSVCYVVKPFDLICMLVDFISNSIIGVVVRKVKNFIRHVKTMFYVRIKFSHSYHFQSNSSKSMKEIANNIVGEVKLRTRGIVSVFQFFNCAASLFFIFLIIRVIYYRHNFLTKERFDNRFMTKNIVNIDLRRAAMNKETVLPLNHRERKKYVTIKSVSLIDTERKQLCEGLALLIATALKMGTHMAMDYSLFWIMNLIRKYGKFQSKVQAPNVPTVHIAGTGFLADLLNGVVKSFQPLGIELEIDTVPCLPMPIPPNIDRYIQIASIMGFCLILTVLEPYGLRWRNWILCYYYPKRAKERAVWLYNHILRSRSSFLKFARRQLRRKILGSEKITKVTCLEYMRSKTNNKCLLFFLGSNKQQGCLVCGEIFRKSDKEVPIRCQRPGCTAIYCRQCFEDLENVCTVCLAPIEYGDLSDISEERDSSDDDYTVTSAVPKAPDDTEEGSEDEGFSTDDYSYSYQEVEKEPSVVSVFRTNSSRDIEMQHIPDYASMQSFDDEIELYTIIPPGFDERDDETQFPEPQTLDQHSSPGSIDETSSAASSFERDKAEYEQSKKSLRNSSCNCLSLEGLRDPVSSLLLEDLGEDTEEHEEEDTDTDSNITHESRKLQTIPEQTEEEPLIDFSSDEEKEINSTILDSESSEDSEPSVDDDDSKPETSSGEAKELINDKMLSDSDLSVMDVVTLIGKPKRKNDNATSTNSRSSKEKIKSSNPERRESKGSAASIGSSERHVEFIGLRKNIFNRLEGSSTNEEIQSKREIRKKYHSTISTKTSKQNIPSSRKEKKSILKLDSGSSIISELEFKKREPVPRLNLASISTNDSSKATQSSQQSKREFEVHHEIVSEKSGRIDTSAAGRTVAIDEEERLKAGRDLKSDDSTITMLKNKILIKKKSFTSDSEVLAASRISCRSHYEDFATPTYPLKSEYSTEAFLESHYNTPKADRRLFDTSDSSVITPLGPTLFEESGTSFYCSSFPYNLEDPTPILASTSSMTTKASSNSPNIEKTRSSIKSSGSVTENKSVRISEVSEDVGDTSDDEEGEATDASSDLSISVQENILGIPRRKKNKHKPTKIDFEHEEEIHGGLSVTPSGSEEEEEQRKDETAVITGNQNQTEKKSDSRKNSQEVVIAERHIETGSKEQHYSDSVEPNEENTLEDHTIVHEPHQTNLKSDSNTLIDSGQNSGKSECSMAQKFILPRDHPEFFTSENVKNCSCCKCRENLPITHHSPAGDPNRRILIHTGVDSCTQTNINRSDRSCQINDCHAKMQEKSFVSSNKRCSVKCKYYGNAGESTNRHKMDGDCSCDLCAQIIQYGQERESQQQRCYSERVCGLTKQEKMPMYSSGKKCNALTKKTVGTVCKPTMHDQVISVNNPYSREVHMYSCRPSSPQEVSDDSIHSDTGSYRDRFDLPYQDNDEYRSLVRELEEKLVARNRERVRRTMREFEKCSTRNQNLRKPILYDDSSCGEEPILTKLVNLKAGDSRMRSCERGRQSSPPRQSHRRAEVRVTNTVETMTKHLDPNHCGRLQRYPRCRDVSDPSHWQMDSRSGEWYKVSDVNICDSYQSYQEGRYPSADRYPPPMESDFRPRRRILECYDDDPRCEECDELNKRYGHRYNILYCPRHRSDCVPRHRRK